MSERMTDDELEHMTPLLVELAEIISPPVAARLRFGLAKGAVVREATAKTPDEIDLVKLARFFVNLAHEMERRRNRCP